MTQGSLPFIAGSATSKKAAEEIRQPVTTLRARVLSTLLSKGPSTDEEMQDYLGMNPSTQRPRRIELQRAGLVRDSGKKRNTRSGRLATVWETVQP